MSTRFNGKDALFSPLAQASPRPIRNSGRRALFSAPPRRRGAAVVECSRCEARTPVLLPLMAAQLVPSLWLPFRPYSRYMRCPTCGKPSWCRVDWRAALGS